MAVEYLKIDELSLLLGVSKTTILNNRVRNPAAVPRAIKLPNSRTLLWRREDVDAFLEKHIEPACEDRSASPGSAPRRGRPRKKS